MSNLPNLKTVKARRGEKLVIDLGKTYMGTMSSWMKKDPKLQPYRSFEILNNRYLILSKSKAIDYIDSFGVVFESVVGTWYFDVDLIEDPLLPDNRKTIFTGSILFTADITNSTGYESSTAQLSRFSYTFQSGDDFTIDLNDQ
jgi:hypothetical protein